MRERCIFGSPVEKDPKWVTRLGTLLETDFLPKFTVQDPNMSLGTLIGLLLETSKHVTRFRDEYNLQFLIRRS